MTDKELLKDYIVVKITDLIKADWNYKEDNDELKEKLKNNIRQNNQNENIIIREIDKEGKYEIINGNHRYDAVQELGITKMVCYNYGKISKARAVKIAIEGNETRFDTDHIRLAELFPIMLEEFEAEVLETTMPYSLDEINNMSELLKFDFDQFDNDEEIETETDTDKEEIICPNCQHKFEKP